MTSQGEKILLEMSSQLLARSISQGELEELWEAFDELVATRKVFEPFPDAQVGVSVSGRAGDGAHAWFYVTWEGLDPEQHGREMAELARQFEGVIYHVRRGHIMPHFEFVTWGSLRQKSLGERLRELASEENQVFCGVLTKL